MSRGGGLPISIGESTITMADGSSYVVEHPACDVIRRLDGYPHVSATTFVAFNQPNLSQDLILDGSLVVSVVDNQPPWLDDPFT